MEIAALLLIIPLPALAQPAASAAAPDPETVAEGVHLVCAPQPKGGLLMDFRGEPYFLGFEALPDMPARVAE